MTYVVKDMEPKPATPAKSRAYLLIEALDTALAAGAISEDDWYRAIDGDGTFLDISCTSGYLMECVD